MKVKIEALRKNNIIPQCKRCQRFGHTQKFCQRAATCVKCAGNHLTVECNKPKNAPPKCSNCAETHPANYRGCLVAKGLQKRRNLINRDKKAQSAQQSREFISRKKNSELSYAQAAKNEQGQQNLTEQQTMLQMLQNITSRLERLEHINTGAVPRYNK